MPISKYFAIWVSHDSVIAVWSFVLCGCNAYQNICHLSKSWFCYCCVKLCFMRLELEQLVQLLTCLITHLVCFCNPKSQQLQSLHPGTPQCKGLQMQASRVTGSNRRDLFVYTRLQHSRKCKHNTWIHSNEHLYKLDRCRGVQIKLKNLPNMLCFTAQISTHYPHKIGLLCSNCAYM